jgi:uncharacterized membrane protein
MPIDDQVTPDDRLMAALAWLCAVILQFPLVSLILLVTEANKERPFQRYHAVASIGFWLVAIAYEVIAAIAYGVLGILTLGCGLACLWPIFFLPHLVALYYAYAAYMGSRPYIPLITEFMQRQGWA